MATDKLKQLEALKLQSEAAISKAQQDKAALLAQIEVVDLRLRLEGRSLRDIIREIEQEAAKSETKTVSAKSDRKEKEIAPREKGQAKLPVEDEIRATPRFAQYAPGPDGNLPLYAPTYEMALAVLELYPDKEISPRMVAEHYGYRNNAKVQHRFGAALFRLKQNGLANPGKRGHYRLAHPDDVKK